MHRVFLILVLTLTFARADDITLRDGTVYKDAKVLSHDATSITILYADGGATLPLSKLPDDLQAKYGYNAQQAANFVGPRQADTSGDWNKYHQALDKYVALDGKLVTRAAANVVTINVKLDHVATAKSVSGDDLGQGSYVDIYDAQAAAAADPSTFKLTSTPVFLKGYMVAPDKFVKIDAVKTGATDAGGVYYTVVEPFSFDIWKKAGSPL